MIKKLYFEGAGQSDTAGAGKIGNDRIRTCFHDDNGKAIFTEIIGHYVTKFTSGELKKYGPVCGVVENCYYIKNPDYGFYHQIFNFRNDKRRFFAYTKENIIDLLKQIDTTVEDIEVDNTGWFHAFRTDDYNFGD